MIDPAWVTKHPCVHVEWDNVTKLNVPLETGERQFLQSKVKVRLPEYEKGFLNIYKKIMVSFSVVFFFFLASDFWFLSIFCFLFYILHFYLKPAVCWLRFEAQFLFLDFHTDNAHIGSLYQNFLKDCGGEGHLTEAMQGIFN